MKDYWLAKLIDSVEIVDSRKRLQKSVFLLQLAGSPLKCDYLLHYYGPYSFELASLIDQLKGANIIQETQEQLGTGVLRYKSVITEKGRNVLGSFEKTKTGEEAHWQIKPFVEKFKGLTEVNLWVLELGATVGYYYEGNWEAAKAQAAEFKKISRTDRQLSEATELAKKYININEG